MRAKYGESTPVISSGITLRDYKGFTPTVRLRYFGPRDLTSDGINRSKATLLVNAGAGYQIAEKWRISARSFEFARPPQ
jgi:hypothetical protein